MIFSQRLNDDLEYDDLEQLGGLIAFKLKAKEPELGLSTNCLSEYTFVNHLSEGGLVKLSPILMRNLIDLEKTFTKYNDPLKICKNYLAFHIEKSSYVECSLDLDVKTLFFRCHVYFTIRHLNQNIKQSNTRSGISKKKIIKFLLWVLLMKSVILIY